MNEELKTKLKELGLTDEQVTKLEEQGAASETDMAMLSAEEIKGITECGLIWAKKVAAAFVPAPAAETPPTAAPGSDRVAILSVLPAVPDEGAILELMKTGGILKPAPVDVISAVRSSIGTKFDIFSLPDLLMSRMEEFATSQDEPVSENFYRLQKLITSRSYADVLSAMGVSGPFMNERRKKDLITRVDALFWPALRNFHNQLVAWQEIWLKGVANPGMAMTAIAMAQSGRGGIMPPGIMEPPPTDSVRDAAEDLVNNINKVFAGTGIPVARAMAYDITRTREVLEDSTLPAAIGATNREQMLKMLGVDTSAGDVRMERSVTQYALAVMNLKDIPAGNEELLYLSAMLSLGATIPWDKLESLASIPPRSSGRGSNNKGKEAAAIEAGGFRSTF